MILSSGALDTPSMALEDDRTGRDDDTAGSLPLSAYGPDEDEARIVEDLPEADSRSVEDCAGTSW